MNNPLEPQPYNPRTVPPRGGGDSRSRFALSSSHRGIKTQGTGQAMTLAYQELLADRRAQLEPLEDPTKTVTIQKMTTLPDGSIGMEPRQMRVTPTHKGVKNHNRFSSTGGVSGGAALDLLFLGELAEANEATVWKAAKAAAEAEKMSGRLLLDFNRVVACLCLARAGVVDISPLELPL